MYKNKKGFTLIELLATIAILAIIATISTVAIERALNKSKGDVTEFQNKMVEAAAKSYANDNYKECKERCVVTIDKLEDYIDNYEEIKDKYGCIKVTKKNNRIYKTEIVFDKNSDKCKTIYVDNSGANYPKLADGMIPVIYDDTNDVWKVANIYEEWYDYDTQMWANAVTVNTNASTCANNSTCIDTITKHDRTYYKTNPGTAISMDDINSMWVWIPRFKYKIPSNIGSNSYITTPPQINVVFETGTAVTGVTEAIYRNGIASDGTNTNYYTHPAFRDIDNITYDSSTTSRGAWDEEITGFWTGKFEMSVDGNVTTDNSSTCYLSNDCNTSELTPTIKPDVKSLLNQDLSNQFLTSLKFANGTMDTTTGEVNFTVNINNIYGLNTESAITDTHMMKNTEWGAVAILSQSQYGKMGNINYEGVNKIVYKNDSYAGSGKFEDYNIYTGRSSGVPPTKGSTTYGTYSYNDKTCTTTDPICTGTEVQYAGTGASTTGTIYGIYDMSGGSFEVTMGNWASASGGAGFKILPEPKYYDLYNGTSSTNTTKEKAILGDATYETMRWYSNYSIFVFSHSPWFIRGSYFDIGDGLFFMNIFVGSGAIPNSFRTILIP